MAVQIFKTCIQKGRSSYRTPADFFGLNYLMMKHMKCFNPSAQGRDFSDISDSVIAHIYLEGTLIESIQPAKARPADRMMCNEVVRCVAHRRTQRLGASKARTAPPADGEPYGHN